MKSIFFILLLLGLRPLFASDNLKSIAETGPWKNYLPDNYQLVAKIGPRAFQWSPDADSEEINDSQVVSRSPYIIFKPNSQIEAQRKTKSDILIYRSNYSFDAKSRRTTNIKKNIQNESYKKNIMLLGCSFTLGTGLNDSETFPAYLAQLRKNYNVYNLGIYGAGANDVLDDLRSFKRFEDIAPRGGIVLYTAIFDHIERTLCTLNCYRPTYRNWVLKKSNYEFDKKKKLLVNKGSFENSRPLKGPVFELMSEISLFNNLNIPSELTDEQIDFFVLMLAEMKKISKEKLKSEFYFTFYPNYYEKWNKIKAALVRHEIKFIDLSRIDFKSITESRHVIILDGHPTKLANYLFANILHQSLPK